MQTEFLIVGQGIAGTFLSYYLYKEKKSFLVIDDHDTNAPSRLAAGIINPVTGRRMVTVWLAEDVMPFAQQAYEEIGNTLGVTAISQKNIIDFFPNPFMRESFLKRLKEGNEYTRPVANEEAFKQHFRYEFGCGEILPVYTAHLEILLPAWRKKLQQQGCLVEETFDNALLKPGNGNITYKDITATRIIFCDGSAGAANALFKQLPFAPNKGEALVAEIPGLPDNFLFKKSMLLAPLKGAGNDVFWIGSNYIWDFKNADPTPAFRADTEKTLKDWLKVPFTILEHRSGIRPATLERRPFVGLHPHAAYAGILNGMGTKGCSLAPFFAHQLTGHLLHGTPIHPEADIRRFARILLR